MIVNSLGIYKEYYGRSWILDCSSFFIIIQKIDGQTKFVHQCLRNLLRYLAAERPRKWDSILAKKKVHIIIQ